MKLNITIPANKQNIQNLRNNIRVISLQLIQFQAISIRKLANQIILDDIQKKMESENFSKKIIQNTFIDNIETRGTRVITLHFRSVLFSESGFDVAVAREQGTKDHFINPTVKLALHWIEQGRSLFSKGHQVSGLKALKIIHGTVSEKGKILQEEYEKELTQFLNNSLKV